MTDGPPYFPSARLINQYCTMHKAVVRDVKDPEGRGRVRCWCPGLLGTKDEEKNWTPWCEVFSNPVGSNNKGDGDEGDWWPVQHGQIMALGFLSGNPEAWFAIPGPPCQDKPKEYSPLIPKEPKKLGKDDPRGATRVRLRKSEAGHTLLMDDRGKKEKLMLCDWTGAGLFTVAGGKDEDEKEKEKEESKPRKGPRRGMKSVGAGTAEKPSKLLESKVHILYLADLGGQGQLTLAKDDSGLVFLFTKAGDEIGPSLVLDSKKKNAYLTAGDMQIQVLGEDGKIMVTRQIIQNAEKVDVETGIKAAIDAVKSAFEEFKD